MPRCQATNDEIQDAQGAAVRGGSIGGDDYNRFGCAEVRVQNMVHESRERRRIASAGERKTIDVRVS